MCADWGTGSMGKRSDSQMVYSPQRRRDAETSAEILGTDGPVVEGDGQPEGVILTRRRGDAEISAEKRRSQREDERGDSGGCWPSVWSGRVSAEILGTYDGNLGLDGCCLARRKRSPSSARIGRLKRSEEDTSELQSRQYLVFR